MGLFTRISLPLAAGLTLCLSGCFGKSGTAAPASFSLAVSPAALSLPAGGGGFATVTVTRGRGATGPITLSLEGAPPGLVGSGTVAAGAQTGRLALLASVELAPQRLEGLQVKGTDGRGAGTARFPLNITAALPAGQLRTDLVQASGGTQRVGTLENTAVALEPVTASTAKDGSGTTETRHGFQPSAQSN